MSSAMAGLILPTSSDISLPRPLARRMRISKSASDFLSSCKIDRFLVWIATTKTTCSLAIRSKPRKGNAIHRLAPGIFNPNPVSIGAAG
jgi:hypothetical protein